MYRDRAELYRELEKEFDSRILVYVTSDRPNMAAQISPDVIDYFIDHLDKIGSCERLSLFLYTRGGDTSTARNIVNLLRMYGENLQVIVPHGLIKKVYDDINEELMFRQPFLITEVNGAYAVRRCILESVVGGADYFSTEGVVVRGKMPDGQTAIQNSISYEGWRHDHTSDGSRALMMRIYSYWRMCGILMTTVQEMLWKLIISLFTVATEYGEINSETESGSAV